MAAVLATLSQPFTGVFRMRHKRLLVGLLVGLGLCWLAAPAWAQPSDAPGPVGGVPSSVPELRLPSAEQIRAPLPRPVKAAAALAGLGRQRLALVLGLGTVGTQLVVAPAARDARAVAAALRTGGFVVMLREDVAAADLRAALAEFRGRLQPGGVGFVYVSALGAQINGVNLLVPRDTPLAGEPATGPLTALLRQHAVTLTEVVAALAGDGERGGDGAASGAPASPRLLVVDAAYRHPPLAALPQAGLAEQPLPPGVMALFGHGLNVARDAPPAAPLPEPPPADPAGIAATPFVRVLVGMLTTPRISGPQALLDTRRVIFDATQGKENLWLGGETDTEEEFAEATLLEALVPRTPEEVAREALRQAGDTMMRPSAANGGERSVAEVLGAPGATPPQPGDAEGRARGSAEAAQAAAPDPPSAGSVGSAVGSGIGVAADLAGAAVGVAAAAATVAVVAQAAPTAVLAGAGGALGAAGTVAGSAVGAIAGVAGGGPAVAAAAVSPSAGSVAAPAATTIPATAAAAATVATAGHAAAQAAVPAAAGAAVVPAAALPPTPPVAGVSGVPGASGTAVPVAGVAAAPALAAAAQAADARRNPAPPDPRTVRNAEGGERPAYVPRRNAFGYAEGDTFSYQVVDPARDQVTGTTTTAIEQVLGEGHLVANGQRLLLDAQGRIKSQHHADGGFSEFVPSQDLWWSHPKPGERRDIRFTETFQRAGEMRGETEWTGSSRVAAPRRIETPAGEFEVLPIESSGSYLETLADGRRNAGRWTRTVYHSTELGHPVAIDIQDLDRAGRLLRRERVELTHAQTSRDLP